MTRIEEVLNHGYQFDMGRYMSNGWNIFKQGAGSYIGFTILYFVIAFAIAMVPFVQFLSSAIQYTLIGGLFLFSRNMLRGRDNFGDFFEGFKYFGQIILYWLVLVLFMMPAIVIFIIYLIPAGFLEEIMSGNTDPYYFADAFEDIFSERLGSIAFLYLFLMLYLIYLSVSYCMTLVLIVDRKMQFWDAMETSRKIVAKNFLSFLGMFIVLGLLMGIGTMITCGLGALIALPYLNTVIFAAYDDILGPEEDEEEQSTDEFGSLIGE